MNIISGEFKGIKLETLDSNSTRPTLTRIKEDIFNILRNYFIFQNKKAIDIFSGSGSLAIEAVSNQIGFVYVNDISKNAVRIINNNFSKINKKNFQIFNNNYIDFLNNNILFNNIDLIFIDPPYNEIDFYKNCIHIIEKNNILKKFGILVIEINNDNVIEKNIDLDKFTLLKKKQYNNKNIYIYRLEN